MRDTIYSYDMNLYNRSFLNCYQRQSVVMLAERVPNVHYLFYRCLISTDTILDQVIRQQRPKYDFQSQFFDAGDLARIGVIREDVPADSYRQARHLLLDVVSAQGYALLVIDVFYLPHCPEYRVKHVIHTIVLKEYDPATGEWLIVDDNPASVLCLYRYPEEVIAASFDNNELRNVRYFTEKKADADAERFAREGFAALVAGYCDAQRMLSGIGDLLACPWLAPELILESLHQAFLVYQGSRSCLREFVTRTIGDEGARDILDQLVTLAGQVHGALLLAKVTGSLNRDWVGSACLDMADKENGLLRRLRAGA